VDLERMAALLSRWLPAPRPLAGEGVKDFVTAPHPSLPPPGVREFTPPPPRGGSESGERDDELPDDYPAIPGIDRGQVARTLGRDRAFFLRLLDGFVAEFADAVGQTGRDLDRGEREAAIRRLHSLRGNAGSLGALDLMATAGALEEAMQRGETDLAAGLEALDRQLAALAAASAPWREAAVPPTPALSEAPPLDPEQLDALREDLCRHNLKALRRYEALQLALTGALGAEATAALGRVIRGLRFEEALAMLNGSATPRKRATTEEPGQGSAQESWP